MAAFMGSSSHRANILNSQFNYVGAGVKEDSTGVLWVSVIFMAGPDGLVDPPSTTTTTLPPSTTTTTQPPYNHHDPATVVDDDYSAALYDNHDPASVVDDDFSAACYDDHYTATVHNHPATGLDDDHHDDGATGGRR